MKLAILDIPEEGFDIQVQIKGKKDKPDTRWYSELLQEAFQEDYPKGKAASLNLHVLKTCNNVSLTGTSEVDLTPTCDLCLEPFEKHFVVPLRLDLAPYHESLESPESSFEEGSELAEADLNFAFYKGSEIDLKDIIEEMIVLEIPIRYLCKEDCKGLCPKCGKNLNQKSCACSGTKGHSQFAVLKKLLKA